MKSDHRVPVHVIRLRGRREGLHDQKHELVLCLNVAAGLFVFFFVLLFTADFCSSSWQAELELSKYLHMKVQKMR